MCTVKILHCKKMTQFINSKISYCKKMTLYIRSKILYCKKMTVNSKILYCKHMTLYCTVGWVNLYQKFETEKYTVCGKLILPKKWKGIF